MSAYDPFALWLMEREQLHRNLEHMRRLRERDLEAARSRHGEGALGTPRVAWPVPLRRRRSIRPLLPGDA